MLRNEMIRNGLANMAGCLRAQRRRRGRSRYDHAIRGHAAIALEGREREIADSFSILRPGALLWLAALVLVVFISSATGPGAQEQPSRPADDAGLAAPLRVGVSIKIDQIIFIDQKSENFGAVAELRMEWNDPSFAFTPSPGGRDHKLLKVEDFMDLADELDRTFPIFLFQNQQAKRWSQEEFVVLHADGRVQFYERSTLTLQAPYLDFRRFPFDRQLFTLEVLSFNPLDLVEFYLLPDEPGFGEYLGEEAWILDNPVMALETRIGATGFESSAVTLQFDGRRHIQYYMLRIFMPILVLIAVAWVTFFLNDYGKRIDISTANLFVFVAFNFAISNDLPQLGYLTFIDYILQWVFIVTAGTIVLNVLLRRLELTGRADLAGNIDTYIVKWGLPLGYGAVVAFAIGKFFVEGIPF